MEARDQRRIDRFVTKLERFKEEFEEAKGSTYRLEPTTTDAMARMGTASACRGGVQDAMVRFDQLLDEYERLIEEFCPYPTPWPPEIRSQFEEWRQYGRGIKTFHHQVHVAFEQARVELSFGSFQWDSRGDRATSARGSTEPSRAATPGFQRHPVAEPGMPVSQNTPTSDPIGFFAPIQQTSGHQMMAATFQTPTGSVQRGQTLSGYAGYGQVSSAAQVSHVPLTNQPSSMGLTVQGSSVPQVPPVPTSQMLNATGLFPTQGASLPLPFASPATPHRLPQSLASPVQMMFGQNPGFMQRSPGPAGLGQAPQSSFVQTATTQIQSLPHQHNQLGYGSQPPTSVFQPLPVYPLTSFQPVGMAPGQTNHTPSFASAHSSLAGSPTRRRKSVKLPKLELVKFKGEAIKWGPFWDSFRHAIDEDPELAGTEKLSYLVSFLEGEPLRLVENLRRTDDNYPVAVRILQSRYGNRHVAVEDIQAKLFQLPTVKFDTASIREFYSELENLLGGLEGVGGDVQSEHLVSVILGKLPRGLVNCLERSKVGDDWSVMALRQQIKREMDIRETTERRAAKPESKNPNQKSLQHNSFRRRWESKPGTADALASSEKARVFHSSKGSDQKTPPKCAFCGDMHYSECCGRFRTKEERLNQLGKARRCYRCLKEGHRSRDCRNADNRTCFHCKGNHHASLCAQKYGGNQRKENAHLSQEGHYEMSPRTDDSESGTLADDEQTVMKTAMVFVGKTSETTTVSTRVFLDCGCSRTYITEKLAKQLDLQVKGTTTLTINRFGGADKSPKQFVVKTASMFVRSYSGEKFLLTVSVLPKIMDRMKRIAVPANLVLKVPMECRLADKPLPYSQSGEIDFLIGNDYIDEIMTGARMELVPGFHIISSKFGWIMSGRLRDGDNERCDIVGCCQVTSITQVPDDELIFTSRYECSEDPPLEDMWSLDAIGIKDDPETKCDDSAIEQFNKTVKFESGRYMVSWPWRSNADDLESNYNAAFRRLKTTVNRVKETPGLIEKYDVVIKDQLSKGIIEEVPQEEIATKNRLHYLPHREVLTPQKATTKLRVVYDASAKPAANKPSLNDCLFRGLVFMTSLVILLIRFRMNVVAIVSDLEKAFLQVGLQPHDRDVTRFLWLRDLYGPFTPENLVIYRFARVAFGMKSSPFLLGATIVHHLRMSILLIARLIERNLYVDNVFHGVKTAKEAITFYHESKSLFKEAGMNLREFASNSQEFVAQIPDQDKAAPGPMKVLGVMWDTHTDKIWIRIPESFGQAKTKREVMENLFKVFDPLGLLCPIGVRSRMLLQKICKTKVKWNDLLSREFTEEYVSVIQCYAKVANIKWPRYLGFEVNDESRLMCFCDASAKAYATAIYVQSKNGNGQMESRLLFAKSRVSPIKNVTIPRLELLAILVGIRSLKCLKVELPFNGRMILWTDSMCCLHWIHSDKVRGRFIDNRLKEIRELKEVQFRFVPALDNPADLPSRGVKAEELSQLWWQGPKWSIQPEDKWPPERVTREEEISVEREVLEPGMVQIEDIPTPFGMEIARFSNSHQLIRTTAWCKRFIERMKRENPLSAKIDVLTVREMDAALGDWLRHVQTDTFGDVKQAIRKGKKHSLKNQLGVFLDHNQILRCGGRLINMVGADETRFPALLPSNHPFTQMVIKDAHTAGLHCGLAQTLAVLRERFWIIRAKPAVSRVIHNCVTCNKYEGKAFRRPEMPHLPWYRVQRSLPFQHVGLDYFGPLYVRQDQGQEPKKVWACLFTCLTTRAVHLDLVPRLTTEEFIVALHRFCARRGRPTRILCDNAANFRQAAKQGTKDIEWEFITPLSPWKGGVYERMIRSVKSALRKTVGKSMLSSRQLETVLLQVENVVNSRPITQIDDEPDTVPLTPNDLLGVRSLTEEPSNRSHEESADPEADLRSLAKKSNNVLNHFWELWRSTYLSELRQTHRMNHKDKLGSISRCPKQGEIVIVNDDKVPRSRWKLARIVETVESSDGRVRSAKVQYQDKRVVTRPLPLLHPLEASPEQEGNTETSDASGSKLENHSPQSTPGHSSRAQSPNLDPVVHAQSPGPSKARPVRPTRAAAELCRHKLTALRDSGNM